MTDREKLIELVGQVQDCGCDVTDVVEMNYVENSVLVDHLIANSVTVRERGRWKDGVCTACDFDIRDLIDGDSDFRNWVWDGIPYCPNCGADMRTKGEGEEDG